MKKALLILVVLSFLVPIPAFAEETSPQDMRGMMKEKSSMKPGKEMGYPGMMSMMRKTSMVASNDGGVIVLAGNKLMKYDANLDLVKEVEVKMPAPMGGKMCPMMKDMEDGKKVDAAAAETEKKPA
ncbi:MAG TPA: hypothetical protein PLL75_04495 [Candidatus Omnitrophota bacterium]|nr:hypothetical protein [Candidatus Omnitrophota bacterium]HPS36970.1 hypothetical protein [Candidatus Omnitrophota bacterium]